VTFQAPQWLLLLAVVPLLAAAYVVGTLRGRRRAARFAEPALFAALLPRAPGRTRHLPALALLVCLASALLTVARPATLVTTHRDAAALVVAIDASDSMSHTDIPPSRLAAASHAADRFIAGLPPHVEVGVVSFARAASSLIPPTSDHDAARAALGELTHTRGTAIGEAVHLGVEVLGTATGQRPDEAAAAPGPPPRAPRIPMRIVLLSDGQNASGRPLAVAAAEAVAAGVVVDTIAFGPPPDATPGATPPPGRDALRALSGLTGGRAYEATTVAQLQAAYQRIGHATLRRDRRQPVGDWFLGLAFAAALAAAYTALRSTRRLPF
jgi:Ca-activated chloride channel family protein